MDIALALGLAAITGVVGAGAGWMLARARTAAQWAERTQRAERALKDESARAQAATAAAQTQAKQQMTALQAATDARVAKLTADHRAEHETLAKHLTEAYDELDRLRAEAAKAQRPGDTGHGFAPTLPLGDA